MVTTFAVQLPVTPDGRPEKVAPVAPVVAYLIFVMGVLRQAICVSVPVAELNVIVLFELFEVTFQVPVLVQPFNEVVKL